jgi:hypothetical protein
LTLQDVQHTSQPDNDSTHVRLKNGSTLIIRDMTTNKLDQLLKQPALQEVKAFWRLADEKPLNKIGAV